MSNNKKYINNIFNNISNIKYHNNDIYNIKLNNHNNNNNMNNNMNFYLKDTLNKNINIYNNNNIKLNNVYNNNDIYNIKLNHVYNNNFYLKNTLNKNINRYIKNNYINIKNNNNYNYNNYRYDNNINNNDNLNNKNNNYKKSNNNEDNNNDNKHDKCNKKINKYNILDIEKARHIYKNVYTYDLIKNIIYLRSCNNDLIRKYATKIILLNNKIITKMIKYTYFKYFCGGESLKDIRMYNIIIKNKDVHNIHSMLDYSIEQNIKNIKNIFIDNILYAKKMNQQYNKKLYNIDFKYINHDNINNNSDISNDTKLINNNNNIKRSIKGNNIDNNIMINNNNKMIDIINKNKYKNNSSNNVINFTVIKLTAIFNNELLKKITKILMYCKSIKKNTQHYNGLIQKYLPNNLIILNYQPPINNIYDFNNKNNIPQPLNNDEIDILNNNINDLYSICDVSINNKISLVIDAEQYYYQVAINYIYINICMKYNNIESMINNETSLIYNTYQLYLKDGLRCLKYDYNFLHKKYKFGLKIVRGAYINIEYQFYNNNKIYYPINDNIDITHKMYNNAINYSINKIYNNNNYYIIIATHNEYSINYSCDLIINVYNIIPNIDNIYFAQLHGMSNYMSYSLANNNFNITKYIPFGEIELVLPYLTRRMQENSDVFNNTSKDITIMIEELKSRLYLFIKLLLLLLIFYYLPLILLFKFIILLYINFIYYYN
jgi:proline dehydrogenase